MYCDHERIQTGLTPGGLNTLACILSSFTEWYSNLYLSKGSKILPPSLDELMPKNLLQNSSG